MFVYNFLQKKILVCTNVVIKCVIKMCTNVIIKTKLDLCSFLEEEGLVRDKTPLVGFCLLHIAP